MKSSENIDLLAAALVKAQAAMKPAKKSESNPYFHSTYADLSNIIVNDKKALSDNGLCFVQGAGIGSNPLTGEVNSITLTTRLIHSSGQWIEDTAGAVPKDFGPQTVGAMLTYLRRYGYSAMVGSTAEGEDDDGETAEGRKNESDEARKPLIDRLVALKEYMTDTEKANAKKTIASLNTPELAAYVQRWEDKFKVKK